MKRLVIAVALFAACSSKKPDDELAPDPAGSGDPAAVAAPTKPPPIQVTPKQNDPAPSVDMPAECMPYKALAEKLADCEKLGDTRATLKAEFDKSWKAWSQLPASELENVKQQCATAATTLTAAVAASCGW
ncbi:MAG: hypothetical protein ABI867_33145 [Kofleriaceae bacterium]